MATSEFRVGADDYWDAQERVFDALSSGDYDLVVFRVGYAGGKTLLLADWLHMVAMQHPGSDNLGMAPDYAKGGPSTYKKIFDRLPGEGTIPAQGGDPENSPIIAEYNAVDKRLTYTNNSVLRLGSADKWNRYAGSEFNAIGCDEPAHYDTTDLYDLTEMLTSRQRTEQGPNVMLWTSTGAGFDDYYDITERQVTADDDPLPWKDRMKVVVGDSRNNHFLPDDALEKLKRQFEGTGREAQALAGGFAAPTGLVYGDFSRERHVVNYESITDQLGSNDWRAYGYDHGWDDPRVVLEIGKTNYDQLVVIDEFYKEGAYVEEVTGGSVGAQFEDSDGDGEIDGTKHEVIDDPWLADKPTGTVYSEHEPEHYRKFRRAGFKVEPAEKDLDEGIPAVRNRLDWRDDPEGRPGLLVCDRCTNTIREFQDYQEDEVGTSSAVDHAMDSLRYVVMGEDGEGGPEGGGTVIEW